MKGNLKIAFNKLCKVVLAIAMIITGLTIMDSVADAATDVGRPSVHFVIEHFSGGITPTDSNGDPQQNTSLISRGKGKGVTVNLVMDPDFTVGCARGLHYDLLLPYFYYDSTKHLVVTYDANEVPADQKDENGKPLMGVGAEVVEDGGADTITGDVYYGEARINGSQMALESGNPKFVQVQLFFYGDVPENTGATVSLGGGYEKYEDEDQEQHTIQFQASPGLTTKAKYNLVCSNLQWDTTITQVTPANVLWDKYNYLVYKVEIENKSEEETSYFNAYGVGIKVPTSDDENAYGLLRQEAMKWKYNPDGAPVENDSFTNEDRENDFIGIPGQGGVLIYDVTDIDEEELAKWDTESFSNMSEYKSLPYNYTINSMVTVRETDNEVRKGEKRAYYFAIPMATNIPNYTIGSIPTRMYTTIYFGSGSNYSWTKTINTSGKFDAPKDGFAHNKYVINNGTEVKRKEVAIGSNVNYYLGHFKNTGNIPVFNTYVIDTLPNNFDLSKINIEMNIRDGEMPELNDWFSDPCHIQFEFLNSKTEETEFVSLGTFAANADATRDDIAVWTYNAKDVVKNYLKSHRDLSFTGRLKINFKERINVKEELDGRIVVNGNVNSRDIFVNQLDTHYEKWHYVPPVVTSEEGFEGGYTKTNKTIDTSDATIETTPAVPLLDADAYQKLSDGTYEYRDLVQVPVHTPDIGYRYKIGNGSISDMIPGIFKSGDFLLKSSGTRKQGFITDKIVFSKDLIENAVEIDSITFTLNNGTTKKLTDVTTDIFTIDEDGNYVLDKIAWDSGMLLNFEVRFNKIAAQIPLSDNVFIKVDGSTNVVKAVKVTGSLETAYNDVNADKKVTSEATIDTQAANPVINVDTFRKINDTYQYNDPTEAPINVSNAGFRWRLANNSVSDMIPGLFKSGDLLVSTGADSDGTKRYGFITDKLTLSKELTDISEIDSIILYTNDGSQQSVTLDDFTLDENGNYTLDKSAWSGVLSHFEIQFDKFQVHKAISNDVYIQVEGCPNVVETLRVTGSFETQYNDSTADRKHTETGTMNVGTVSLEMTGYSFNDAIHSGINTVKNTSAQSTIHSLTVANKKENTGYDFTIVNNAIAPVGAAELKIDFLSVGNKSTVGTVVKGFDTKEITISDYVDVMKIKEIKIYDWDQSTNDTPAKVIQFADLTENDGAVTIDESMLDGLTRIRYVVITCEDWKGQDDLSDLKKMNIHVTGNADWFENLDAKLTITPEHFSMKNRTISLTNRLYVEKPRLDVHANLTYYENTPEQSHANSANTDGNEMYLAVPYDRDFKYRVSIENKSISVLDDVDLIIDVPVNNNEVADGEDNTGFHTTKVVINEKLLKQFKELDYITFYDIDSLSGGTRFNYDEDTNKLVTVDGIELVIEDGVIEIDEKTLNSWGINNLGKVIISGQKVILKDETTDEAWVDFYGFSDSLFGTTNRLTVNSNNYLDGIRDLSPINAIDHASIYLSKMYFDTTIVAGYIDDKDNVNRFEKTSASVEHVRNRYRTSNYSYRTTFDDNSELDVGYKAIGSFLVDFRQYLNVGTDYPVDIGEPTFDNYISQEHRDRNYVYTQSLNTAANVNLKVDIPKDAFDAYYLKIDPRAKDYFNSITVLREDGTRYVINRSDWQDNSVEKNAQGKSFFRINLLTEDEQKRYETVGTGLDNDIYYKELADYVTTNPIKRIIINLDINNEESSDGVNANNPDYGTWYVANDQKTKFMFEVTGRFYTEGGSTATVSADLTVGGERGNSADRTGHKAKERTASGDTTPKSNWSYYNHYRCYNHESYYYGWHWVPYDYEYDSAHLKSTTRVYAYRENNRVLKGVHTDPSVASDVGIKYGDYNEFAVSFYRELTGTHDDYLTGQDSNLWIWQDAYDWIGKHAYSDLVTLEDTFPAIRPDSSTRYYGFLTQKIFISPQLYKYIDTIEIRKKIADDEGNQTINSTPIILTKDDLKTKDDRGFYNILINYNGEDSNVTDNQITLAENEFLYDYKITLKGLPGNGDYARELENIDQLLKADGHESNKDVDIYVGGEVYLVKDIHPVKDATNTMKSTTYKDNSTEPVYSETNTAYMQGYRLPFYAGYDINSITNANRIIYDYHTTGDKQNIDPNYGAFEVKIWNRTDTASSDGSGDSAHIKETTITNTMNANYRLKNIYIPEMLVDGDWFNISSLRLNYGASKNITFTLNELKSSVYFTKQGNQYIFDVNKFVKDHVDEFETYTVANTTDRYVKEHISSFVMKVEAVNVDPKDGTTVLDSGQYLSSTKDSTQPTFTYDGVYVDRIAEDIEDNVWTKESRPTIIHDRYDYMDDSHSLYYNNLSASFVSSDMNAEQYQGNLSGTDGDDYYCIRNVVGTLIVNMTRGSDVDSKNSFAYDVDKDDSNVNTELAVDTSHLLPDDYVEYHLTVGSKSNGMIPIYHPDVRFTVPAGQRIVGWRIETPFEKSNISNDDITATVGTTEIKKDKIYSQLADGVTTNYKELNISVGDLSKSKEDNYVLQGDKVVIVVMTQLTTELSPFEGKTMNATYEAAARPEHTYSQYMIQNENGQSNNYCSSSSAYYSHNDGGAINYYRYDKNFRGTNNEITYTSEVRSSLTFFANNQNLGIEYTFNSNLLHFDRQGMTIKSYGANKTPVINNTNHTLDSATYTMAFLSESNGRLYKGFDLTIKPEFKYPENMTEKRPIKVEYCYFDDDSLVDEGVYANTATEIWISEEKIVFGDVLSETDELAGKRLARDAVKIRWTYYDIPAWGTDGNVVTFASATDPFVFEGEGRYRDIRTDAQKNTIAYADRYTMKLDADYKFVHKHNEIVTNTIEDETNDVDFEESVQFTGSATTTKAIARERPIMTLHTQIFDSSEKASATYQADKQQKMGYRPNETVWFKTTVINNALTEANTDTGMQGALLDPIIYDKIPEYITTSGLDKNQITVVWYDKDGNQKEVPEYKIIKKVVEDVPDYGGDIVTSKSHTDGSGKGNGHAFADINMFDNGNTDSTPINYNLYTIEFEEGTRLEIGERIEIHYSATIRESNLPLAYSTRNGKTFVDYYPKMGEYTQRGNGYESYYGYTASSYPYLGRFNTPSQEEYYGDLVKFENSNVMMDMNYLHHDVGLSGTRNPNIDRYEFLKDAIVYMPGTSNDGTSVNDNYGGSNGYLKDFDMCVTSYQQQTRYVPTLTVNMLDQLPQSENYVNPANNRARDYYSKLMSLRNRSYDWQDENTHEDALIWTQSRTHLQTAWLATSSQMYAETNDYLASTEYIPTAWGDRADPHYHYATFGNDLDDNVRHTLYRDDNVTALEYDQNFMSRIGAYNYGDWDLTSGIEFIYVLPRGVEPRLNDDGSLDLSALKGYRLNGGTSLNPTYAEIDTSDIQVSILQRAGEDKGYYSPRVMQDPLINQYLNRTAHNYANETNEYFASEDGTPWVLKVTVNQSLKKWFNRGADTGYMMLVDIPTHVYKTNPSEYWYDEVMARPLDVNDEDSLYYQIYDTTSYWGNNLPTSSNFISTQYGSMDYMWNSYCYGSYIGNDERTYFLNGSPNTPYINGMNISNREVSSQNNVDDAGGKEKFSSGKRNTYASTGTRAHMRKPVIRTWTTVGNNNISGNDINGYYVNGEGDSSKLHIHVENKYYLNDHAPNIWRWNNIGLYYKVYHTYAVDGGSKGTLYYPVVTNILPAGIVPKDENGHLFTENNETNKNQTLSWSMADGNGVTVNEKDLYNAKVEYVELESEEGNGKVEGRYKITFVPKSKDVRDEQKAKITSGSTRIFSFDFFTTDMPDRKTKTGTNGDLLYQYQKNHNYVSSQLDNFKFLLDSDMSDNPYWVGSIFKAFWAQYYNTFYRTGDSRKDSVVYSDNYITGGVIPNHRITTSLGSYSILDSTDEGGNKRYTETQEMQLEDYDTIRWKLTLNDKDFNENDSDSTTDAGKTTVDSGVHTSNRIRVKHPGLENQSFVSKTPATNETDLGGRSPDGFSNQIYEYYPNKDTYMHYGDNLYYNVRVSNHSSSATDYSHQGNILHSKINVSFTLPSIVSYRTNDDDRFYVIYTDSNGQTQKATFKDLEESGYTINLVKREENELDKTETVVFDIITPGDNTKEDITYQDYVDGYKLPGYFGSGDHFVFGIKTVIDRMGSKDTLLNEDKVWDDNYKADVYVSLHDNDGSYLQEKYPEGSFDKIKEQSMDNVYYVRKINDDLDQNIDYNLNQKHDVYTADVTAKVTILKPEAVVRVDTSVNRILISNPDAGIIVAEDPTVKGARKMTVYVDEAINKGGAVPEFIVDYRIPFHGKSEGSREEATIEDNDVYPFVYAIGTGKWSIPESAGSEEYRAELAEHLKVHVFALVSDNEPAKDDVSYEIPGEESQNWIELTDKSGVSIDENHIIDLSGEHAEIRNKIYQIRYVVTADSDRTHAEETRKYPVPQGFRMDIDADPNADGKQEMDEVDPGRHNIDALPDSVVSDISFDTSGDIESINKVGNAAFVITSTTHTQEEKQHVNHFAKIWARYDDEQIGAISERSRAGYYISREIPTLQVDLFVNYFKRQSKLDEEGNRIYYYSWVPNFIIDSSSSMLKYKATLANLSQEQITGVDLEGEPDMATNPQMSTVLPYVQDISNIKDSASTNLYNYKFYKYVKYGDENFENESINSNYTSTDRLIASEATWTWHVEDEDGNLVEKSSVENVNLRMYDKAVDLTNLQRRVMTWDFKGTLQPGQKIVIDYMVPISTKENGVVSSSLLECKSYGFKEGTFNPYIPISDNANETYALELDTRDINDNELKKSEITLVKSLGGLAFASNKSFTRVKVSHSEYGSGLTASGNGNIKPSLVPEGSDYSFTTTVLNPDSIDNDNGYKHPIIYDVLPFEGDKTIITDTPRNTKWRGYLNLESITVGKEYGTNTGVKKETLIDGQTANVWVGPFKKENGKIVAMEAADLPEFEKSKDKEFYKGIYGESSSAIAEKQKYFVRLRELLALKSSDPKQYEDLQRAVQAIYVEPSEDFVLRGATKLTLTYKMKAPLNLPMYPDYITEDDADLKKNVADYSGWNTFAAQSEDEPTTESPQAGVYLDAPADKGYIGHYVWLDESYNAQFTDEGEYIKRDADGRWLFNKATKDLDHDGKLDDPGINGVKVELLSEKGYPVNRLGEPVVEVDGNYYIIDEDTGNIALDTTGTPAYTIYGPEYYITEKDAYGNDGYFIISNITPGKYKLRYTFPEGTYDEYSLTTKKIGSTGTITGLDVYRKGEKLPDLGLTGNGDEPSDNKVVNGLVIQTKEAIQIDAIGKDPSTYKAYDEMMTCYDIGIAHSYIYGGYAWFDESPDPTDSDVTISNGIMDDGEKRLANVVIQFYEVQEDGTRKEAYNGDGELAIVTTDENGYFKTELYPYKSYVAVADTSKLTDIVYKPTPFTLTTNPLENDNDNDQELDSNKKNVSFIFKTGPVIDEATGKPIMNGHGSHGEFNSLGFGFVEAGKGFIGKNIFDDKNYDGIRNQYTDANGNATSEPGIDGVEIILEQYYYDTADNTWKYVEGADRNIDSVGGSYIFQNVRTTYTNDDGEQYLAGYKVKLNTETIPEGYTPTKYHMGNGVLDSDLPVDNNDQYRYLSDMLIIAADVTDNPIGDNVVTVGDKKYDVSDGLMLLDNDAGLTTMDKSIIEGIVWDDKNYDGQQNEYTNADGENEDEPGISDVELQLIPYYYDDPTNTWKALDENAGNEYRQTTTTNDEGIYKFTDVPSYVKIDNKNYLVSYKIKVLSDITEEDYAITRYHIGNDTTDSDLIKDNMLLNEDNEYIIVAKKIAETNDQATVEKQYGKTSLGNRGMLIHNKLGYFDINKVINIKDNDAGLIKFEKGSILGSVWEDADYDGIIDDDETGIANVELKLMRYYWNQATQQWIKDELFNVQNQQTDANGDYIFENLDSYVYVDGQYYLAGYKVQIVGEPDRAIYAITLYRQETEGRNSDLRENLLLNQDDEYIIVSDEAKSPENSPYVIEYQGKKYDLVEAREQDDFDAGYIQYPKSKITGKIFDDIDYDGLLKSEDGFTEELKEAIQNDRVVVTATAYYYDQEWKLYQPDGATAQTYTAEVTSASEDGYYEIEVPTQFNINGSSKLAGYKLEVNIVPEGYRMTKYLKNKGVEDSSLVKKEEKYQLTKTGSKTGYLGELKEELEGIIIAAGIANKETLKDNVNVQRGYDIATGRTLEDYNAGYTKIQSAAIEGISFNDINYDGIYDQTIDKVVPNTQVGIKRYYYDNGEWILDNEAEVDPVTGEPVSEYYQTLTTDANGYYKFDNLPTYKQMSEDDMDIRLYGYTVWYIGGIDSLAVTKYQTNEGISDSALNVETNQVVKADGTIPEMKDGYTIIAEKADSDQSLPYVIEGYDIADGRTRQYYNLGFTNYQEGVIEGKAFIEEDYNGIFNETDKPLEDIEVGIKRYVYNPNTKEWLLDQEENQEYFATTKTDSEGYYSFNDLGTYKDIDGVKYLYGYKVWLIKGLEETPVTKYQTNNGVDDNALLVDTNQIIKKNETIPEMKDGYIIVADKPEDMTDVDPFYVIDGYDIISAKRRNNYNIGYVPYQMGSIEGIAFDDLDYDGIYTAEDRVLKDVEIGLKRYYYDLEDKKWHEAGAMPIDEESQEQYLAITKTDDKGYYIFDNLPSFIQLSETKRCLYGYELWMLSEDGDRLITKYQMNNGERDSAVIASTHQIIKKDKTLPEMKDSYIIIGDNIQGETNINTRYVIEGYDIVKGEHRIEYNMGFIPKERYHIQGNIWKDLDGDGIDNDDKKMKGLQVTLEKYYLLNGKWIEMDEKRTMITDTNGNYIFDNLDIYGIVDEQEVVYGYKVKIEELPKGYDVTKYQVNNHVDDSDLNIKTGYLEENGALIVLADKADETTSNIYNKGGYNISHGHSQEDLDGGLVPYRKGMLQGVVFKDDNKNGIFDGEEKVIEGAIVYLDYLVEADEGQSLSVDKNMVYESGRYESFKNMKAITDSNGIFTFEDLPVVDENNNAYQYRLRMYKPDGTQFTTVYPFVDEAEDKRNIYGGRVTQLNDANKNEGITQNILLTEKKVGNNYYQLGWEVEGKEYTRIYLGYSPKDKELDISVDGVLNATVDDTPSDHPSQPKTSDSSQPEVLGTMMILSGLYIVLVYRRRRRETE